MTARRLVERCQIVLRAGEGDTNEQIAAALGITSHRFSIPNSHRPAPRGSTWWSVFFHDLTVTRLRSGVFHSLPELIAAVERYLLQHNKEPKPYIWTAQAKDILAKVTRARAKLNRRKRNIH